MFNLGSIEDWELIEMYTEGHLTPTGDKVMIGFRKRYYSISKESIQLCLFLRHVV